MQPAHACLVDNYFLLVFNTSSIWHGCDIRISDENWPVCIVTIAETSSLTIDCYKSSFLNSKSCKRKLVVQFTNTAEWRPPSKLELWATQLPIISFSVCGAGEPTHCASLWYRLPAHVNKAVCSANPSRCWLLSQRVTVCQSTSPGAHDKERTFACLLMFQHP